MSEKILVTGGFGFIGSHFLVAALKQDKDLVVIDDFSNSYEDIVGRVENITGKKIAYEQLDITDKDKLARFFETQDIDSVVHFAGKKSVEESMEKPAAYYATNVGGTINLIDQCLKHKVKKFIFSSSATVYEGNPAPFREDMPIKESSNPYGETKIICDRILEGIAKTTDKMQVTILRYFNPIGNLPGLRENPKQPAKNIIPILNQIAEGEIKELLIFGDDYNTKDGTAERDYIHILDLVDAHLVALDYTGEKYNVFNIGVGRGISVKELVQAYEIANNVDIPRRTVGRRPGDLEVSFTDTGKASQILGWKAQYSLEEMLKIH